MREFCVGVNRWVESHQRMSDTAHADKNTLFRPMALLRALLKR